MSAVSPQHSEWFLGEATNLEERSLSATGNKTNINSTETLKNDSGKELTVAPETKSNRRATRFCWKSSMSLFCQCCILGSLIAGISLAVLIALWLTSKDSTTTTSTVIQSGNIITSAIVPINTTTSTITSTTTIVTTTTTTSTSTSTTTTANICVGISSYVTQIFYMSLTSFLPWTKYSFNYTSPNVSSVKLFFALRNDPDYWYLDDVSVTNSSGSQRLTNNGFETGALSSWTYCNPSNATFAGAVILGMPHTGSYSYADGSVGAYDYLSQSFTVSPFSVYNIQFWLAGNSTNGSYANVFITA